MPVSITNIPTFEPRDFVAGETLVWRKRLPDFPATDWTLSYFFRGPGAGFDAVATADGRDYLVTVTDTRNRRPGDYYWQSFVEKSGERYQAGEGKTVCKRSLSATIAGFDGRSQLKQILDAIDALVVGKATKDQQQYRIGTRELMRIPITELIALRDKYAQLYAAEVRLQKLKDGAPFLKNIHARFTSPR